MNDVYEKQNNEHKKAYQGRDDLGVQQHLYPTGWIMNDFNFLSKH